MNSRSRRSYSSNRVRWLVEDYEELCNIKDVHGFPLDVLVQLCDLGRALPRLNKGEREVLLVCGIAGVTVRTAGALLGADPVTTWRRYMRALEKLTTYMNGAK
jgi:DNA-directed RNA polymerase specialized sigma24 family protein